MDWPTLATVTITDAIRNVRLTSILLKNPLLWRARALDLSGVSEADSCLFALCGEDRRREGDKLRQFSQILGGGG